MRGATHVPRLFAPGNASFNPRPPCGERHPFPLHCPCYLRFQSTPPVRGATAFSVNIYICNNPVSIHAPRAGSDKEKALGRRKFGEVSIHAPRAGSDARGFLCGRGMRRVSIHAPRAGSDRERHRTDRARRRFNPRPPCGERHRRKPPSDRQRGVSIHAPRAGSDPTQTAERQATRSFNPRPPCGERQHKNDQKTTRKSFNPRPPCGERPFSSFRLSDDSFNPRPPCGERLGFVFTCRMLARFQSTPPVRGATLICRNPSLPKSVSIHAPRAGSDNSGA
ncbi:Uncharacterized protein dnm_098700 [Desulfonema magnum]|uniref:Uncharacterized protein n=1 Tax=Desulfonema magnum TaxID=45655 RepID=A0A975GU82_9BACT|nr:Uncharacterized protein dnm_098700 [Desulfonema magnum]